jgi:hypothetical protein
LNVEKDDCNPGAQKGPNPHANRENSKINHHGLAPLLTHANENRFGAIGSDLATECTTTGPAERHASSDANG